MRQVASAIILFLLSPFNWILILIVAGFFFRRAFVRKVCRLMALGVFLLFGNPWLLNRYAKRWQPAPVTIARSAGHSCGIIAGGFASPDANEQGYFNAAADRFIQAVKLYKLGQIKHLLVSGGNGKRNKKNFREAQWVKGELITMGIPDSVIFIEDRSNSTADNALYAKKILDSAGLMPPYLLITSAYHIPRASLIFSRAGVNTDPYPCNYNAGRAAFGLMSVFPQPYVLLDWNTYFKEALGYFWYSIK